MHRIAWLLLLSTNVASAEVRVLGWTADGAFVVDVTDAKKRIDFGKGQERFFATCAPVALDVANEAKTPACSHCGSATDDPAKTCGLAKPAKVTASLKSPDGKLTLAQRASCVQQSGGGDCTLTYTFGKHGTLEDTWAGPTKKPSGKTYWRPDSQAVLINVWNTENGREDHLFVVDVGALKKPKP